MVVATLSIIGAVAVVDADENSAAASSAPSSRFRFGDGLLLSSDCCGGAGLFDDDLLLFGLGVGDRYGGLRYAAKIMFAGARVNIRFSQFLQTVVLLWPGGCDVGGQCVNKWQAGGVVGIPAKLRRRLLAGDWRRRQVEPPNQSTNHLDLMGADATLMSTTHMTLLNTCHREKTLVHSLLQKGISRDARSSKLTRPHERLATQQTQVHPTNRSESIPSYSYKKARHHESQLSLARLTQKPNPSI